MEEELLGILREHVPLLRSLNFVTDTVSFTMRSKSGAIVEAFEWASKMAKKEAHKNKKVKKIWDCLEACCDFPCLAELPETMHPFAAFESVRL